LIVVSKHLIFSCVIIDVDELNFFDTVYIENTESKYLSNEFKWPYELRRCGTVVVPEMVSVWKLVWSGGCESSIGQIDHLLRILASTQLIKRI